MCVKSRITKSSRTYLLPLPPSLADSFQSAVLGCELLCRLVLDATEAHTTHDILVESALEVLILLSQNGGSHDSHLT